MKEVETLEVFLLGANGSGKDAQAEQLVQRLGCQSSAIGMSAELKKVDLTTAERAIMAVGQLLPDERVVPIWAAAIRREIGSGSRVIMHNGTLRRDGQTKAMLQAIQGMGQSHQIIIVEFDVPEWVCLQRIEGRRQEDIAATGKCRPDDMPEVAADRQKIYRENLPAIHRVIRELGLGIIVVRNDGSPEKTKDWTFNELLRQVPVLNARVQKEHQYRDDLGQKVVLRPATIA